VKKARLTGSVAVLRETVDRWFDHKAPRMGGALSYYTAFSIGPLLLIAISLAGILFGPEAARNEVFQQLRGIAGDDAARAIQDAVQGAHKESTSILASIVGVVSLLIGATGVFGELHDALNTIWGVEAKAHQGILKILRERFLSFTMVLGTGFLLIVSLVLTATLSFVGKWLSGSLPGGEALWQVVNSVVSFVLISLVFALILKYVPDIRVRWREVLIGGFVTGLLFTLGKLGLGLYVGKAAVASTYGAAGSLLVLLLWVFYSAQILYFGAELSRALAKAAGVEVKPRRTAIKVFGDERTVSRSSAAS
jgi:membrane protein